MKKLNKLLLTIAFVFVIVVPMLVMSGCFGNEKKVARIELTDDIKMEYTVGENFDKQDAKLRIVYSDESTDIINIVSTMISGFDATTFGANKTLTISYAEKSITVRYSVDYPFDCGKYLPFNNSGDDFYKTDYKEYSIYSCYNLKNDGTIEIYSSDRLGNRLTASQIDTYAHYQVGTWTFHDGKIDINGNIMQIENRTKLYVVSNTGMGIQTAYFGKI